MTETLTASDLQEHCSKMHDHAKELERFLAQEDFDASEDARIRLADARKSLRWAASDFELAAK